MLVFRHTRKAATGRDWSREGLKMMDGLKGETGLAWADLLGALVIIGAVTVEPGLIMVCLAAIAARGLWLVLEPKK